MMGGFKRWLRVSGRRKPRGYEIEPDEIFLDASNLPAFDRSQLEGQLERSLSKHSLFLFGAVACLVAILFLAKIWELQITNGAVYAQQSENNRLEHTLIFADRGVIYDRRGEKLAWNRLAEGEDFAHRAYYPGGGFGHVLGYLSYPQKDTSGNYFQERYEGLDGVEKVYDGMLQGINGLKIVETDARHVPQAESIFEPPEGGGDVTVTLDAGLQQKLFSLIEERAHDSGYRGGSAVIIDVNTGDILALTNYPEYDPEVLASGTATSVQAYTEDSAKPFLNRAVSGLYTPGSIIKPFIAAAALEEGIINPSKQILSTGSLTLANPYNPSLSSVFNDWKAHGYVDLRRALAVSSNVYFFEIGGGFGDQPGLGITKINTYVRKFGFGEPTGFPLAPERTGTVPNPAWKQEIFDDEWRLGDTYNTAIGQYGFQVTPLQAVRGIAAIANGGLLVTPSILTNDATTAVSVGIRAPTLSIVREGMRMAVTEGTAGGLSMPEVAVAAKTGTAELGTAKEYVNSWVVGFFPYEKPKYAFVVMMERGPRANLIGGVYIMRRLFEWMALERPHYLTGTDVEITSVSSALRPNN